MVSQPYLYQPTNRTRVDLPSKPFDPKAVTRASYMPPPPPKPKPTGPLINFNQHPDSYLILPYGQTDTKPMHPKTKQLVAFARWTQLFLRVLGICAAIGTLVLVICIKNISTPEGWILRLPVSIDILHTLYAIYHLCRSSKSRTPGSSASYHFFALVMDTGLIPFYAFMLIATRNNLDKPEDDRSRWETLLTGNVTATEVMTYLWYAAIINIGLHGASDLFSLLLLLVFRRISQLPPDMNPLEDNLTSRRSKHKHKNSELSISTMSEKRASNGSTVRLATSPTRRSYATPRDSMALDNRNSGVTFMSTREGDSDSFRFSPHNPRTLSHMGEPQKCFYQQPASTRASYANLAATRGSFANEIPNNPPSRPLSALSPSKQNTLDGQSATASSTSTIYADAQDNNWITHDAHDKPYTSRPKSWMPSGRDPAYKPVSTHSRHQSVDGPLDPALFSRVPDSDLSNPVDPNFNATWLVPQPLSMNPLTPPPDRFPRSATRSAEISDEENSGAIGYRVKRGSVQSGRGEYAPLSGVDNDGSSSPTRVGGTPKRKYYGDLAAATRAVRGGHADQRQVDGAGRVVSRSGVDEGDLGTVGYAHRAEDGYLSAKSKGGRRREVSGKVAEEGRGGISGWQAGLGGLVMRKTSTGR